MMRYFSVRNSVSGKILILGSSFKMIFPIIIEKIFWSAMFWNEIDGSFSEAYSEPIQTSKMERLQK